jgi:DNA-binding beta-propeller fold protein YncE
MPLPTPRLSALAAAVSLALLGQSSTVSAQSAPYFERIASFPVFLNTDIGQETVAEIVAASTDGTLLIYTDSEGENVGFVDITDPGAPKPGGIVALDGEPTSVAVVGNHALVAVNTSTDFVNTGGQLVVIDLATRAIVATHALGGQPDSVAVSPDGRFAAIAIENERDEDLGDGEPPQAPAGFLTIVDLVGAPAAWSLRQVDLTGVADLFPDDPEPEYVSINRATWRP